MFIEIKGIGLPNRGAELMLIGIIDEVKSKYPQAKFVLMPDTPYMERVKHKVYQKSSLLLRGFDFGFLGSLIPKKIRRNFGLILESEIDVIIDASGFAYSDQWGADKAYRRSAKYVRRWKKDGKKVIFMPQAFGPFENIKLQQHMKAILQHVDLIFARDEESLFHLEKLQVENKNLLQAPDFTNLIKGKIPVDFESTSKDICFITNAKMIDKGGEQQAKSYKPFMISLITRAQELGFKPYLLLHEGENDFKLAKSINKELSCPVNIVQTSDALEVKGIIGTAKLVVSSRFHGLVSALSQGVPVIATGWSHKYKMLLNDYKCGDYLLSPNDDRAINIFNKILQEGTYLDLKNKIIKASKSEKYRSRETWAKVFKELSAHQK
jgi:colanic acid/amylovoran biosynthesis protein